MIYNNKTLRTLSVSLVIGLVGAVVIFGNSCAGIKAGKFKFESSRPSTAVDTFGTAEILGVEGQKTVSFASFALIQDLFVSLMNSQLPLGQSCTGDANIQLAYEANRGSFSLDGAANSYSAEMQMAVIKLAAAVSLCGVQRGAVFLGGTNAASALASVDAAKIASISQSAGMVFWGGKYDAALLPQLNLLVSDIKGSIRAPATGATQQVLVGLLTSIIASFWGIEV
ncbi:MAG: hypothetical protein SGJ18_14215 [Pseudomonadota bacterium]|nr:hypothetical protein [Pseudomonadota bacterium]